MPAYGGWLGSKGSADLALLVRHWAAFLLGVFREVSGQVVGYVARGEPRCFPSTGIIQVAITLRH